MSDNTYNNQRGIKSKADVVGGIAIPGFKIVVGDDDTDGGYVASADGQIRVISQSFDEAISQGIIIGSAGINKFGANDTIGTTEEAIWTKGGLYSYLAAAETLKVSSTAGADDGDPAGTGARTVTIVGHAAGYVAASDAVTLNGAGSVETSVAFLRVFRVYVASAGSGKTNAGTISVKDNADSVTLAQIEIGRGQTQMAIFSVATGEEFHLEQIIASESSNKKTLVRLYAIDRSVSDSAWLLKAELTVNLGSETRPYPVPLVIVGPADIELRGIAPSPSGAVEAGFSGYTHIQNGV